VRHGLLSHTMQRLLEGLCRSLDGPGIFSFSIKEWCHLCQWHCQCQQCWPSMVAATHAKGSVHSYTTNIEYRLCNCVPLLG